MSPSKLLIVLAALLCISHAVCQEGQSNSDIVSFTKRVYSALGSKTEAELVEDFKGEYETLNYDGSLGEILDSLYEMRLEDLQISVRHAKKMRDLLDILEGRASDEAIH